MAVVAVVVESVDCCWQMLVEAFHVAVVSVVVGGVGLVVDNAVVVVVHVVVVVVVAVVFAVCLGEGKTITHCFLDESCGKYCIYITTPIPQTPKNWHQCFVFKKDESC